MKKPPFNLGLSALLAAMKDIVLDSAALRVVYDRTAIIAQSQQK